MNKIEISDINRPYNKNKHLLIIISIILCIFIIILFRHNYISKYKTYYIDSSSSEDGKYEILFQSVGSPDFPFGNTHARLILKDNNNTLGKYDFEIANDGKNPGSENWSVKWYKNNVQAVIRGEEQQDMLYTLYFDGTTSVKTAKEKDLSNESKDNLLLCKAEYKKLDTNVFQQRPDELLFSFTVEDYINDFNAIYWLTHEKSYILPLIFDNWIKQTIETGIHSSYETTVYDYSADREIWTLPTISLFTTPENKYLQEISLNFDWHSYTEELYSLYKEMCFNTLKILLPDCSDAQITKIYSEAIQSGYDNVFPDDEWYGKDSVPADFYYIDSVGIYSHFAIGTRQRLCIIPITEKTPNEFSENGASIHKIISDHNVNTQNENIID